MNPLNLRTCPVTIRAMLLLSEENREKVISFLENKSSRPVLMGSKFVQKDFNPEFSFYAKNISDLSFHIWTDNSLSCRIVFPKNIIYTNSSLYPGGNLSEAIVKACANRKMSEIIDSKIFHGFSCEDHQESKSLIKGPAPSIELSRKPKEKIRKLLRANAKEYEKWLENGVFSQ